MKRFARMLFAGLGFVIVGAAMSLAPHRVATAGGMTAVTVTNPSLAVTQSGPWNVGLTGMPAVSAAQSGSWNVGITGTPGVTVANATSQPVPTVTTGPSLVTHMGQLPSNHVVLTSFASGGCTAWTRVHPDGSTSAFAIPPGEDLVITDAELEASTTGLPGTSVNIWLAVGGTAVLAIRALADPNAVGSTQQHFSGGIVVSVLPTCSTVGTGIIRGYLIPAS